MSGIGSRQSETIEHARRLIAEAERVMVLTGAGISAESGVPTFRGQDGLWKHARPEDLATPAAFARDPRLVWEWYGWRRERVAACAPNVAHLALASFARRRDGARIVTQNVDGLHARAGRESADGIDISAALPLELHGSLFRVRCLRCAARRDHSESIDATSEATLPRCGECSALLRPDVVWFGESLDEQVLEEAFALAAGADLCLVVGTSALVHPAASLPMLARDHGASIVEVNPEHTPLTGAAAVSLRMRATEAVPAIVNSDSDFPPRAR